MGKHTMYLVIRNGVVQGSTATYTEALESARPLSQRSPDTLIQVVRVITEMTSSLTTTYTHLDLEL